MTRRRRPFRLEDPEDRDGRRVRLVRPERPVLNHVVVALLGFVAGSVLSGGYLGGVVGAVLALLVREAWVRRERN